MVHDSLEPTAKQVPYKTFSYQTTCFCLHNSRKTIPIFSQFLHLVLRLNFLFRIQDTLPVCLNNGTPEQQGDDNWACSCQPGYNGVYCETRKYTE